MLASGSLRAALLPVTTTANVLDQEVPPETVEQLLGYACPGATRVYRRWQKKVTCNVVERITIGDPPPRRLICVLHEQLLAYPPAVAHWRTYCARDRAEKRRGIPPVKPLAIRSTYCEARSRPAGPGALRAASATRSATQRLLLVKVPGDSRCVSRLMPEPAEA